MTRPLLAALLCAAPALAQTGPAAVSVPNVLLTPGAVDPTVTLDTICNRTTRERRRVPFATSAAILAAYGIPEAQSASYELDHLIPLAIGGSNLAANLWPQPWVEADLKDRLEVEMQRRACVAYRTLTPTDAEAVLRQEQREIATDWGGAYVRYLGPMLAE